MVAGFVLSAVLGAAAQGPPPERGHSNAAQADRPSRGERGGFRGGHKKGPHFSPKAGDWLRKFKDLPAAEQESALNNDPDFQRLPHRRQQELREHLRRFNNMPPEQQQRLLDRMAKFQAMTPEHRQRMKQLQERLHDMPEPRRRVVRKAFRHMMGMPPEERRKVLESDRFKQLFSEDERELIRGLADLEIDHGGHEPPPQDE